MGWVREGAALSRPFSYHPVAMAIPRVLVVMEAHWPRALLLAALQDAGYDTLGAPNLREALEHPARQPGRGQVGLIVLDHHISPDQPLLRDLLKHFNGAVPLHLESALQPSNPPIEHSLRYPVSIGDIVQRIEDLLPLEKVTHHKGTKATKDHLR
jgi:hypothetical protein